MTKKVVKNEPERSKRLRRYALHRPVNIKYPTRWKLGKVMQYMKLLEDTMEKDPTKIKYSDYMLVVNEYMELNTKWQNELKVRRASAKANKNTQQGVGPGDVSEDGGSSLPDGTSQDERSRVGVPVPAKNPFTG